MKTLEERAHQYAHRHSPIWSGVEPEEYKAYIAGATEQKRIDIDECKTVVEECKQVMVEKACEYLEKYMESLGYIDEWCRNGEDDFRKAMAVKESLTTAELTWEDCKKIVEIADRMLLSAHDRVKWEDKSEQDYYEEVLRKFKGGLIMTQEQFIDKACECLENTLPNIEYITNASALRQNKKQFIDAFRKAMETCNSDKNLQGLTWHKVSEELPPVDTEVVCKMKGVPFTEHFICKWNGKYWVYWGCFGQGIEGWFGLNIGWEVVEWKEI